MKVFMRPHWNAEKGVMHLACLKENFTRERTFKLLLEWNNPTCKFPKARQYVACLGNNEIPHARGRRGFFNSSKHLTCINSFNPQNTIQNNLNFTDEKIEI